MDESDLPDDPENTRNPVPVPFSCAVIRRITKQSLVSYPVGKDRVRFGISQKATVLLSLAAGVFLQQLAVEMRPKCTNTRVSRRAVVSALLESPRYRFAVTRLRTSEIFPCFVETTELSKRIAVSEIEKPLRFPIEFVAPFPPGSTHGIDEREVARRERENVDTAIKAIVLAHHAYRQVVPECFKPKKFRRPGT
jgi:hypothetical protein